VKSGRLKLLQWADRRIGPSLCRRMRPLAAALDRGPGPVPPDGVQRILVIRPGGLGDAALTCPMLRALRAGFPGARLDVLVEARNAAVFGMAGTVDGVHRYDQNPLTVRRRLRRVAYDIVVDTEQYHHLSTIFGNSLRPRYLCGFATLGRARFQTHSVAYSEDTYEARSFLDLASALLGSACAFDADHPFIDVAPADVDWATGTLAAAAARPVVAITPAASGHTRIWPAQHYAQVAAWLQARGHYVVLLGGADAVDAAHEIEATAGSDGLLNLAGATSLAQSAALLRLSRLSISADTGVLHLAYGVGTPTVSLFGSGLHRKWGPPGRQHRIVRKNLPCSPCIRFGRLPPCPHDVACMRELTVVEVTRAVEDLLHSL
jgi:lipopolysaccharide heptosyltransferase II